MKMNHEEKFVLFEELEALANEGMLSDSFTPEKLNKALSPQAIKEWNAIYESCIPSPEAKEAGLTERDILNLQLQVGQLIKETIKTKA